MEEAVRFELTRAGIKVQCLRPSGFAPLKLVRKVGVEPTRLFRQGILSPSRLPFRHKRISKATAPGLLLQLHHQGCRWF